jgi:hypothetical protein
MSVKLALAYIVPGASAMGVRALVALELVDEHTVIQVVVRRAHAARRGAGSDGRAVRLMRVLERARLVVPGTGAVRVCALVALQKRLVHHL